MVIILDKKEFADAVHTVARFAERRSATLPVLSGIALIAGDDGVKLRATNLETGIDLKIAATIKEPGVVALPAQVLREITTSFSGTGTLTLEHSGDTVRISSGTGKSTIKTLAYEDFPILPIPDAPTAEFSLPGALFRTLVSSVVSYASPSTVRPELASVLVAVEGGMMKAVSTDSFRLAEKKIALSGAVPAFSILIPARNAVDVIQTIPDTDIKITLDDHQCVFSWDQGLLVTRLVTASYPDYAQIIPKTSIAEATVLKKDFESVLKRTSIFSDTFQKVRMTFDPGEKKVTLAAQNADVGESSESITGNLTGEGVELSFNHRYLSAPLGAIGTESINLSASGIGRALIIRGTGDTSFLYLVMPMNQ
ncbi:MAG: Beta sliding clamp [Parcubacteria group bacterium]|nr:Beta sliding clamp [Parcubacteria group bacterium]